MKKLSCDSTECLPSDAENGLGHRLPTEPGQVSPVLLAEQASAAVGLHLTPLRGADSIETNANGARTEEHRLPTELGQVPPVLLAGLLRGVTP